jgi:hypothetical protein
MSFAPLGLVGLPLRPQLTLWAAFLRRVAAKIVNRFSTAAPKFRLQSDVPVYLDTAPPQVEPNFSHCCGFPIEFRRRPHEPAERSRNSRVFPAGRGWRAGPFLEFSGFETLKRYPP